MTNNSSLCGFGRERHQHLPVSLGLAILRTVLRAYSSCRFSILFSSHSLRLGRPRRPIIPSTATRSVRIGNLHPPRTRSSCVRNQSPVSPGDLATDQRRDQLSCVSLRIHRRSPGSTGTPPTDSRGHMNYPTSMRLKAATTRSGPVCHPRLNLYNIVLCLIAGCKPFSFVFWMLSGFGQPILSVCGRIGRTETQTIRRCCALLRWHIRLGGFARRCALFSLGCRTTSRSRA